jgi:hypothetical protein
MVGVVLLGATKKHLKRLGTTSSRSRTPQIPTVFGERKKVHIHKADWACPVGGCLHTSHTELASNLRERWAGIRF